MYCIHSLVKSAQSSWMCMYDISSKNLDELVGFLFALALFNSFDEVP